MNLAWLAIDAAAILACAGLVGWQLLWERRHRHRPTEPPPATQRPITNEVRLCSVCGDQFTRWSFVVDGRCVACQEAASEVEMERHINAYRKQGWADQDDADRKLKAQLDAKVRAALAKQPKGGGIVLMEEDEDA